MKNQKNIKDGCFPKSFYENIVEEQKYNFTKGMVNVGFYWERLKKIYEYYPPEQVLLLKQEDMLATPDKIYAKIYKFLGVKYVKRTYGFSHRRKYNSKIDNKSFELLSEIYKSKNLELAENIGIDYNKKLFTDGTR